MASNDWPLQVPVIKDWVTLPVVAQALGISRQRAHEMAREGKFASLHRLEDFAKAKTTFVVSVYEVAQLKAQRDQNATDSKP